jgi:hypothetical protein
MDWLEGLVVVWLILAPALLYWTIHLENKKEEE